MARERRAGDAIVRFFPKAVPATRRSPLSQFIPTRRGELIPLARAIVPLRRFRRAARAAAAF